MDEQWINDAVAEVDRAGMRPGFEAELRSALGTAWDGEHRAGVPTSGDPTRGGATSRRWWAITSAAAIIALVIGAAVVVSTRSEPDTLVSPPTVSPTTAATTAATTADTIDEQPDEELIASLVDRTWLITEVDGVPRNYVASFTIDADGTVTGFDGCNNYSMPVTFTAEGLAPRPGGDWIMNTAHCNDPYDTGWTVEPGVHRIDGDTLTIVTDDGRRFDAVDRASLPPLDDPQQLAGTWTTAEGVEVTFTEPLDGSDVGSISLPCGEFGTWTVVGRLRTTVDQAAYAECVPFGEPSLGWVFDSLIRESPTIRVLPDGSLVFGTSQFGRLLPTDNPSTTPDINVDVDLTIPVRSNAPVPVTPLTTIPWGRDAGEIAPLNGEFTIPVALFSDTVLVLENLLDSTQLSGRAFRLDRSTGGLLDPVRIEGVSDPVFWSSGSPDGTLYLATGAGEDPIVVVSALRETTPGVFTVVDEASRDGLGDSEFRLTARGVELGGDVMIASDAAAGWPTVDAKQGTSTPTPPMTWRWIVTRYAEGPTQQDWTVDAQLDSQFPPGLGAPLAEPLGGGALFSVVTSNAPGASPALAYLAAPGERDAGGSWDLGGWQLADHDPDAALLVRVGVDGLELGFLDVGE